MKALHGGALIPGRLQLDQRSLPPQQTATPKRSSTLELSFSLRCYAQPQPTSYALASPRAANTTLRANNKLRLANCARPPPYPTLFEPSPPTPTFAATLLHGCLRSTAERSWRGCRDS